MKWLARWILRRELARLRYIAAHELIIREYPPGRAAFGDDVICRISFEDLALVLRYGGYRDLAGNEWTDTRIELLSGVEVAARRPKGMRRG